MKKLIILFCLATVVLSASAQQIKLVEQKITGTWKFSKKTVLNDYEQVFKNIQVYETEYYTFNANRSFQHFFIDKEGNLVKMLNGSWRSNGEKIHLKYKDVDYKISLDYHFTDYNLVFVRDHNMVILTIGLVDYETMAFN